MHGSPAASPLAPPASATVLARAEFWLLVLLAIFLPLVEAPKNIVWGLYVVVWIAHRARIRDFGGSWDGWDTLIAAWIGSGWLAAAFAGLHGQEWHGPLDLVRYGSILWLVRRTRFTERELEWLLAALVASTLAGLAFGYWRVASAPPDKPRFLELRSVGHVNHSAIYMAIMAGLALAGLMAWWSRVSMAGRAVGLGVVAVLAMSVVATASRGAIGTMALTFLALGLAWWPRSRAPALILVAAMAVAVAGAIALRADVVKKVQFYEEHGVSVLSHRDEIWSAALAAAERYPWFGVGMDNYNQISMAGIEQWRKEAGKPFDPERYAGTSHAHSLYLNTLAERGIAGLAALLAVLAAWFVALVRGYPGARGTAIAWALWGGALSAWLVSVATGFFNTTLHHEHAILSVLLLGLWLAWRRGVQ